MEDVGESSSISPWDTEVSVVDGGTHSASMIDGSTHSDSDQP